MKYLGYNLPVEVTVASLGPGPIPSSKHTVIAVCAFLNLSRLQPNHIHWSGECWTRTRLLLLLWPNNTQWYHTARSEGGTACVLPTNRRPKRHHTLLTNTNIHTRIKGNSQRSVYTTVISQNTLLHSYWYNIVILSLVLSLSPHTGSQPAVLNSHRDTSVCSLLEIMFSSLHGNSLIYSNHKSSKSSLLAVNLT